MQGQVFRHMRMGGGIFADGQGQAGNTCTAACRRLGSRAGEATESSVQGVRVVPLRLQEGLGMPCVLVEVGYLTNTAEEALLQTEAYQERLVQGIVKGITQVLQDEEEL